MPNNRAPRSIDFEVRDYSLDALKDVVADQCKIPRFVLDAKQQFDYLNNYLLHGDINAASILVEPEYIDRDYLADYAGYYVRCFAQYGRWCSRLHFFSDRLDKDELLKLFRGEPSTITADRLKASYIGFLVIKPLPETMIGRTCLKTYGMVDGRDFPNVRRYRANLFGIELEVKSLAFQEQDSVAAACASSALWTAFQGTGLVFQHDIPSPLAITRLAVERSPTESRTFPAADGLDNVQMAEAIRGVGLDPLTLSTSSNWALAATAYAYLRSQIPVVWLGFVIGALPTAQVDRQNWLNALNAPPSGPPGQLINVLPNPNTPMGGHATTIVGYRLSDTAPVKPIPESGTLLRSSKIDKLYMHDDNVGPFARVEFEPLQFGIVDGGRPAVLDWFSCKLPSGAGRGYVPHKILVPLFTTIRISFHSIFGAILLFDTTLETLRSNNKANFNQRFEWDIFLSSSNDYKTECFRDSALTGQSKESVLLTALPRYVWIATAYEGTQRKFDFVFDSTDVEQGLKLVRIVSYSQPDFDELLNVSDVYSSDPAYSKERLGPHGKIWEYIHDLYLDKTGTSRP